MYETLAPSYQVIFENNEENVLSHTPEILGDVHWSDSHCAAAGRCDPPGETGRAPTVTQLQQNQ